MTTHRDVTVFCPKVASLCNMNVITLRLLHKDKYIYAHCVSDECLHIESNVTHWKPKKLENKVEPVFYDEAII